MTPQQVYIGPFVRCRLAASPSDSQKVKSALQGVLTQLDFSRTGLPVQEQHLWVPAQARNAPRDFWLPEQGSVALSLRGDSVSREMHWFTQTFQDELAILADAYPDVQIDWGVLRGWH
jgi:hypothetical protein